jgi:hypothetical protein
MKKTFCIAIALLPVIYFLTGCKKDSATDPASLFKNTVWTGEFKYGGAPAPEPYSLECKADGSFNWREYSGTYGGTWKLDATLLTLTFNSGTIVKAEVLDNKTLGNIQNNPGSAWTLNSGEFNTATGQVIDGTSWKENSNQGTIAFTGTRITGKGLFFAGMQNEVFSRAAGTILVQQSVSNVYFCVLMPDGKTMRLVNKTLTANFHPYVLTRE